MKALYVKPVAQTILLSTNRIMGDDLASDPFALDDFDDNSQVPSIDEF